MANLSRWRHENLFSIGCHGGRFFFIISETFSGNKNTKIITTPTVPSGCNCVYETRYDISTIGPASNILARVRYLNLHSMLARVHARRKIRHACANGLVTTKRLIRRLLFTFKNYELSRRLSRQSGNFENSIGSRVVAHASVLESGGF